MILHTNNSKNGGFNNTIFNEKNNGTKLISNWTQEELNSLNTLLNDTKKNENYTMDEITSIPEKVTFNATKLVNEIDDSKTGLKEANTVVSKTISDLKNLFDIILFKKTNTTRLWEFFDFEENKTQVILNG